MSFSHQRTLKINKDYTSIKKQKMEIQKTEFVKNINAAIAVFITKIVGTMWCAYAFTALAATPLLFPGTNTVIMFLSSSFLQLVLLPLIMVGQAVNGEKAEKRAKHDHRMIKEELLTVRNEMALLTEIIEGQRQNITILTEIHNKISNNMIVQSPAVVEIDDMIDDAVVTVKSKKKK
jgi:hypothetical protein